MFRLPARIASLALAASLSTAAFAQEEAPAAAEEEAGPATTTYALSSGNSDLYVILRNDTSATLQRLGHDHVIYASAFTGTVVWPNVDGAACSVDISVPVMKLTVDPSGSRNKAGLDDNTIDAGDKEKLSKNMWGKSQLDAGNFSNITFKSTSCSGRTGSVKVQGTMTIRGKSQPVSLTMQVKADGSTFSASGRFNTSHTAFGFKPFAASALGPRNADKLNFVINARGKAQ